MSRESVKKLINPELIDSADNYLTLLSELNKKINELNLRILSGTLVPGRFPTKVELERLEELKTARSELVSKSRLNSPLQDEIEKLRDNPSRWTGKAGDYKVNRGSNTGRKNGIKFEECISILASATQEDPMTAIEFCEKLNALRRGEEEVEVIFERVYSRLFVLEKTPKLKGDFILNKTSKKENGKMVRAYFLTHIE